MTLGAVLGLLVAVGVLCTAAAAHSAMRAGRAARARESLRADIGRAAVAEPLMTRLRRRPAWFERAADELPASFDRAQSWRWYRVGLLAAGAGGYAAAGPVLGVLAAAAVGVAPVLAATMSRTRKAAGYDAALAAALDATARVVRGGGSLPAAVAEASTSVRGPVAADLQRIGNATARGERLEAALAQWCVERDRASVRLAVGAIGLAATTGGPPARVIEDVAASLRVRMQVEGEARALGAQARLSAIVVGLAPIGFALVSCMADPRNAQLMFGTPIGIACLAAGLALDAAGAVWMHRISETVLAS